MNQFYLQKKGFTWKAFQTKEYIAYYLTESKAEKNLSLVETKISAGIAKAKEITKTDSIKTPVYYFIVDNKEKFQQLTKLHHTGISFSKSNTIIESYFLLGQAHEVVHLITDHNWGNTRTWVSEGFSVYSDNTWSGKTIDKLCAELYIKKELIPINQLIKKNSFKKFNTQITYPQSGSVVKYLIANYGWDKFKLFWKKPDFKKVYNLSEAEIEQNWINYIHSLSNLK